jgi:hypothetical protein
MSYKATKELIEFAPEIDRDQTAMGLPPVTFAVLLIAKSFDVTGYHLSRPSPSDSSLSQVGMMLIL